MAIAVSKVTTVTTVPDFEADAGISNQGVISNGQTGMEHQKRRFGARNPSEQGAAVDTSGLPESRSADDGRRDGNSNRPVGSNAGSASRTGRDARRGNRKARKDIGRPRGHRPNIAFTELSNPSAVIMDLGGDRCILDQKDYELVQGERWYASRNKRIKYACAKTSDPSKKRNIRMHAVIMGRLWIDHIDGNGLNNSRSNLRPCDARTNSYNSFPLDKKTSIYKGVHFRDTSNLWIAQIMQDGIRMYLGAFSTEAEAALEYDSAAADLFGEFAKLNFPATAQAGGAS